MNSNSAFDIMNEMVFGEKRVFDCQLLFEKHNVEFYQCKTILVNGSSTKIISDDYVTINKNSAIDSVKNPYEKEQYIKSYSELAETIKKRSE